MDEKTDIKRFNNIFVTHRDRYIRFAYSYTYNQEAAEDLVTESLMYYWENRHRLEEVKDIPLYILVTLKNKCLEIRICSSHSLLDSKFSAILFQVRSR